MHSRFLAVVCGIILFALAAGSSAMQVRVTAIDFSQWQIEYGRAPGPDGSIYLPLGRQTVDAIPQVLRINPDGAMQFFPLTPFAQAAGIALDGAGFLWYASYSPGRIGRLNLSSGAVSEFEVGNGTFPIAVAATADGNAWLTQRGAARITRVTPQGDMTHFPLPDGMKAEAIVRGGDGNLWFAEGTTGARLGRMTPNGEVTLFTRPNAQFGGFLAVCGDGNVWFSDTVVWGRITPAGIITEFKPATGSVPYAIDCAPDGTLWGVDSGETAPRLYRMTPNGQFTSVPWPVESGQANRYASVSTDGAVWVLISHVGAAADSVVRIAPAATTPTDTTVVEFFNVNLGHYFVTANNGEAIAIDGGSAGPGWSRTGETWKAWVLGPIPSAPEVCRFYGTPGIGPNSHFYTADFNECAGVKQDPGWTYEEPNKFWVRAPVSGGCTAGSQPIYRAYNNRFAQNDSNHRYASNSAIYNQMIAQGWIGEGVVYCAPL